MDESSPWKIISSKIVYKNKWIRIREDSVITPQGNKGIYGFMESNDSVAIIALNDKNEVYLIRTFRYPSQSWNWELPGGGGENEDPLVASKRELEEETGIIAKKWTKLGLTSVSNGLMTEKMSTYLARDLSFAGKKEISDEVVSNGKFMSMVQIDEMVDSGELNDGQSLAALYLLNRWLSHES